jgi:hypothetical protein
MKAEKSFSSNICGHGACILVFKLGLTNNERRYNFYGTDIMNK